MAKPSSHLTCAVAICSNPKDPGILYHSFPRDPERQLLWKKACLRKDVIKPRNAYICSNHFVEADYARDLKHELLGLPPRKKLRKDAVPSQNLGSKLRQEHRLLHLKSLEEIEKNQTKESIEQLLQQEHYPPPTLEVLAANKKTGKKKKEATENRQEIKVLNCVINPQQDLRCLQYNMPNQPSAPLPPALLPTCPVPEVSLVNFTPSVSYIKPPVTFEKPARFIQVCDRSVQADVRKADEFLQIETRMKRLERDNQRQKETILFLRKRLKSLTSTKVAPKKIAFAGQETPLSVIPVEQLSSKQKIDKSKIWTEQEIVNFLMLKTVSMEAYELIKQNQMFPIPTTTTLNKFGWLAEKYRITQNGFVEKIPVPESEPDASPHLNPTSTSNEDIDDSSSKMQE